MDLENIVDDLDRPIWGAEAIGRVINRTQAQAFHLLQHRRLDADKAGHTWVSTPRRLLKSLGAAHDTAAA